MNRKILVACEESQTVCKAFRAKGHEAYSCDIMECSGGALEWHIKQDVLPLINGNCEFKTVDGAKHEIKGKWDLIIAHPPCTYLSTAATQCHSIKCFSKEKIAKRTLRRIEAMQFFMRFINADCDRIAIENPTGVMNTCFRKPDQTIHPYYFAKSVEDHENYVTKKTGLWLKGLEPLKYECVLPNPMDNAERWGNGKKKNWTESNSGSKVRSKTFQGVAEAMAEQWGNQEMTAVEEVN